MISISQCSTIAVQNNHKNIFVFLKKVTITRRNLNRFDNSTGNVNTKMKLDIKIFEFEWFLNS